MTRDEDRALRCLPLTASDVPDELQEEDEYALLYEWAELLNAPPPLLEE